MLQICINLAISVFVTLMGKIFPALEQSALTKSVLLWLEMQKSVPST
jgi:hypothetical protein